MEDEKKKAGGFRVRDRLLEIKDTWNDTEVELLASPLLQAALEDIRYLLKELTEKQQENQSFRERVLSQQVLMDSLYKEKEMYRDKLVENMFLSSEIEESKLFYPFHTQKIMRKN